MKSILKITTVLLVQALLTNFAWGCVLSREPRAENATLSPAVQININAFQKIFAVPIKDGYLAVPGTDEEIGAVETAYLEFKMIYHRLNNVLQTILVSISNLEIQDKVKNDEKNIIALIKDTVKRLDDITSVFSFGNIVSEEDVLYLTEQVKQLNDKRDALRDIDKINGDIISQDVKDLAVKISSAAEFVNRRMRVVTEGVKLEYFDLAKVLNQEKRKGTITIENGLDLEIFGYRDGIEFVIKNIIHNIYEHGNSKNIDFEMSVKKDAKDIVMEITDEGRGFDIQQLKDKAVELGFWDKKKAASAAESDAIELIFAKGFSRRYIKGKAHGLGMWLSRQVIEKYFKGKISARNRVDCPGAKFVIAIPAIDFEKELLKAAMTELHAGSLRALLNSSWDLGNSCLSQEKAEKLFDVLRDPDMEKYRDLFYKITRKVLKFNVSKEQLFNLELSGPLNAKLDFKDKATREDLNEFIKVAGRLNNKINAALKELDKIWREFRNIQGEDIDEKKKKRFDNWQIRIKKALEELKRYSRTSATDIEKWIKSVTIEDVKIEISELETMPVIKTSAGELDENAKLVEQAI